MAVVEMYIDAFSRVVRIDEDHPLAIAQREPKPVSLGLRVDAHGAITSSGPVTADPPVVSAQAPAKAPPATVPSAPDVAAPRHRRKR